MPEVNGRAHVREASLTLPTYRIKGANRNPVFRSQYGVAHIYPYTLLDDIESTCANRTYRTLELENQYLRVTVLPELGGRVYSVFDKVSQCEVFYKNPTVRFAPLAIRGAFFSGGVEFSFPVAHAPTTCDKVHWVIRENDDGSASVSVGALEHMSGLRWTVTLTLYADRCALAQDVWLFNPGTVPGRYHYWTNASLDANEGTEFIYPLERARSYEFAGTASWPVARLDLILDDAGLPGMEGVPMWPASRLHEPINFRWQKNMLAQVSVFGRNVASDYFGAWQHKVDHGYAHVASCRDVSGMKLWSWGNAAVGVVNQTALTDDGSLYAETQCGAMETQLDFDFLPPGGSRGWREWWIPLRGLGGLTCASETIGAKINLVPIGEGDLVNLVVALCPAEAYESARVRVTIPGKILLEETFSASPRQPWSSGVRLPMVEIADNPITLVVEDSLGRVLLENTLSREPGNPPPISSGARSEPTTGDDLYRLGLEFENLDNREQARDAYVRALQLQDDQAGAHLRYALLLLRAAQYAEADAHFSRAVELGVPEAAYYRGLIAVHEGRWDAAEEQFESGERSHPVAIACKLGLAKCAMRKKDWDRAISLLRAACEPDGLHEVAAATLMGIALRHGGRMQEAHAELERVLRRDPLNYPALHEMARMDQAERPDALGRLQRFLADDDQLALDLGGYYMDAGLPEEASELLLAAWSQQPRAMTAYLLALLSHETGETSAQKSWLEEARHACMEFGFPSRLEEVAALRWALEQDPQDPRAKYLLGNFLYAHEQYDEAIQLWTDAARKLEPYDVLFRNLGLAAWQRKKDASTAIEWFEKALALNPGNQDLYLLLDEVYKSQCLAAKRDQLLEKMRLLPEPREDIRKHGIRMMVELGHHQEAIDLMTTQRFVPLEMDQSFHDVYVEALMLRARDHLSAGRTEEAVLDYQRMLDYPENLGVGAPTTRAQAHIYYGLGLAYEKLGRYRPALKAWREAASEHHPHGSELFRYIQMALDKLSRYSALGLEEQADC